MFRFAPEMAASKDHKSGVIGEKIEYLHRGIFYIDGAAKSFGLVGKRFG
jgi:hypothetical protein